MPSRSWRRSTRWPGRGRAPAKRDALRALRGYVVGRLDLAAGRGIGSGPTEAACKTLTLRLKGPGMKWDCDHAAARMNRTAVYDSGQADAYWHKVA